MLVRQAISFTYQGRPTGGYTELGAALANALLRDYAKALGIHSHETEVNFREYDYKRACGYSMSWEVPESMFDRLNTIGDTGNDAFTYRPALGKYRPALNAESLSGQEIAVDLGSLISQAAASTQE